MLLQDQAKEIGKTQTSKGRVTIYYGDVLNFYNEWPTPIAIISDGPYGLGKFTSDPVNYHDLPKIYEPHIIEWTKRSSYQTTLWFWNSEIGWATVHPILEKYGWKYVRAHIWDKGISHVAGNSNSRSLRQLPTVSEICVQYIREAKINNLTLKEWIRKEWERTGLPLYKANEAAGVKNAATRKYLTQDHLWYFPPAEHFIKMVIYANTYGKPEGKPYFSIDGKRPITGEEWEKFRAKFYCPIGVTNVWRVSPTRGKERLKINGKLKALHANQKPLELMQLLVNISTEPNDVIWEPFGGMCSASVAAARLNRVAYCAEIEPEYYKAALIRLKKEGVPFVEFNAQSTGETPNRSRMASFKFMENC